MFCTVRPYLQTWCEQILFEKRGGTYTEAQRQSTGLVTIFSLRLPQSRMVFMFFRYYIRLLLPKWREKTHPLRIGIGD